MVRVLMFTSLVSCGTAGAAVGGSFSLPGSFHSWRWRCGMRYISFPTIAVFAGCGPFGFRGLRCGGGFYMAFGHWSLFPVFVHRD